MKFAAAFIMWLVMTVISTAGCVALSGAWCTEVLIIASVLFAVFWSFLFALPLDGDSA